MSKFYYGNPATVLSDVCDTVGKEWGIDDIAAIARMIRVHPSGNYVADDQPLRQAIADAIRESGEHGDADQMEPLAVSAEDGDLDDAISALAQAVTIDSGLAGHSVASAYVEACRTATATA